MGNIEIWYRRQNETKHHLITRWINRNNNDPIISWKKDINDKLFQFTIKLYNPYDEDNIPFIPNLGDEFTVTDWQNNVLMGFNGIAEEINRNFYGLDDSEEATNKYYNILVQSKDFSTAKAITEKSNSTYIYDLLPEIFASTPDLGGILQNGIVIPKHDFGGENFLIPPFKITGTQYERLAKILDLIGWSFNYFYFSELSETNGLHKVKQISMFPKNQGKSPPDDWIDGITFEIYKNGVFLDRSYPDIDNKLIICEKNISYKKSNRNLKNSIELKLNVKSDYNGVGKKFRQEVTEKKTVFDLGGTFDVNSIAIEVLTNILSVTSDSIFTISEEKASAINYYQQRMNNNSLGGVMKCRINSGGTDYDRVFTINVSTNTITLISPISGLVSGSLFTLTGAYDLLMPNLTSYPSDGNGYVIKTIDSEKTTIKFTDYDTPKIGSFITGYYFPVEVGYKTKNDVDSINKLGFRGEEEEIKEPITSEQAEELFIEKKKRMKALEVITLDTSHRKNILDLNTSIDVDFEDIKGKFIVTASEGRIIHDEGFYINKPLILQDIELSTYPENAFTDLMSKIQNNSKALTNLNLKNNVEEIIHASIFIKEVSPYSSDELITPIMLDATNILSDRFTMNFISSNVTSYRVLVSSDSGFLDKIVYNLGLVSDPETPTSADISIGSLTYPIWVKLQAIRGTELSSFSNIKLINLINTDLYIDSYTKAYYDFQNNYNSKNNTNHASGINSPSFVSGILTGDTYSLQLDGINQVIQYPNAVSITRDITIRIVKKWDNFTRTTNYLHTEWYGYSAGFDYRAKIIIAYNKINNKFEVTFYNNDSAFNYLATESSTISLNTTDKYLIQLSWNNSTCTAILAVNGTQYTLTKIGGSMDFNTLNLKDSISPKPIYYGAYTYPDVIDTSLSPACKIARLVIDSRSRTFVEHQADYTLISPKF